jgi:hypothetical protein
MFDSFLTTFRGLQWRVIHSPHARFTMRADDDQTPTEEVVEEQKVEKRDYATKERNSVASSKTSKRFKQSDNHNTVSKKSLRFGAMAMKQLYTSTQTRVETCCKEHTLPWPTNTRQCDLFYDWYQSQGCG